MRVLYATINSCFLLALVGTVVFLTQHKPMVLDWPTVIVFAIGAAVLFVVAVFINMIRLMLNYEDLDDEDDSDS